MAKISGFKALLLGIRIANDILAALGDPLSPGEITHEELKVIIDNAVQSVLGKPA
jgi:hypothetical protein